jgi:hypothetical protein
MNATPPSSAYVAAHSTGGKTFTTVLKSRFPNAPELFIGNIDVRKMPESGLDLLLVDEAHRVRKTSDTRFTAAAERNKRSQIEELLSAAKVTVFLLDENQYMRPDEIGSTQVTYYDGGKRVRKSLKTQSKRVAERERIAIESRMLEPHRHAPESKNPEIDTFWTQYLTWAKDHLRPTTISIQTHFWNQMTGYLKPARLGDVTRQGIEDFKRWRREKGSAARGGSHVGRTVDSSRRPSG